MVKQFTSTGYSRNRLFADNGVPPERQTPEFCRTQEERNGSTAYTRREPKHDPCSRYDMGKLLAAIRGCCHPEVAAQAESWVHMNSDAFIRQPAVLAPSPNIVRLEWRYDVSVLRIRFHRGDVLVNNVVSTRGAALEAVLAWNAEVIRGEMARIRAAGVPAGSPALANSALTEDDGEW